jgi:3-hydroxy-9,10-secoandrosta-1,3,5(10)-triene-9,17-dione monooxygenase
MTMNNTDRHNHTESQSKQVAANSLPDRAELKARAEKLAPVLRERAHDAAENRSIPEETIADFHRAGFFRILQPKRWGGLELDPQTFYDVQIAVGAGCPSSAWVLGVLAVHHWQLSLFSEQAQIDVWGENSETLVSSSYMPVGKVTRVEGGYRLSGRWGFSSGSAHCQWAFLGAFVPPDEGHKGPDMRTFLVPRSDYQIEDVWHVAGLKATGSNDVVVDDVFVPEHHTHRFRDGFLCQNPGNEVNPGPLYRLPFGQIFVRSVSTPAIAMAEGALSTYVDVIASRVSRADNKAAVGDPTSQRICADAAATIDEAKTILHRNFDIMMEHANNDRPIPLDLRIRYRNDSCRAVLKCVEVVDKMLTQCGGRAIFLDNPMQRFFQDIHACRAHYANNPDKPLENLGRVMLGMDNQDFFL